MPEDPSNSEPPPRELDHITLVIERAIENRQPSINSEAHLVRRSHLMPKDGNSRIKQVQLHLGMNDGP